MKKIFKLLSKSTIKHAIAFTLAEVVLVMGIIGVVGVLAVTNAKKDTDTAEKVAQLKKTYDILNTAFAQAVMENGAINTWGTNGAWPTTAEVGAVISPYLKLLKNCGTGTGCWKNATISDNIGNIGNLESDNSFYKAILSNGVLIAIYPDSDEYLYIYVDVNGKKGLNTYGNDVFEFYVYNEGDVVPEQFQSVSSRSDWTVHAGYDATAWVLKFGNMDYLKSCADSLSWTGDHTCR